MRAPRVRALAYHAPLPEAGVTFGDYVAEVEERCGRALSAAGGREIWTRRLVLPDYGLMADRLSGVPDLTEAASELASAAARAGCDYLAMSVPPGEMGNVVRALEAAESLFISVRMGPDPLPAVEEAAETLLKASGELGPESCARLGLSLGPTPETPYFPVTASRREGVSAALLYAGHLVDSIRAGVPPAEAARAALGEVHSWLSGAASSAGVAPLGVDPSVSPWMGESSLELVEIFSGGELWPGAFWAVREINSILERASSGLDVVGYSEVMLPLAEDDALKTAAASGEVGIRDLVALSSVCAAGLDMVPVSTPGLEGGRLAQLIMDAAAVAWVKGGPYGVRLIPVDASPGEWVDLGRFGDVPVPAP